MCKTLNTIYTKWKNIKGKQNNFKYFNEYK